MKSLQNHQKGIWLTWERQTRNHGLSSVFGYTLIELDIKKPMIERYLLSIIKTIASIRREKPDVVVAQNPSIVLCIVVGIMKPIFKYFFVMDAHNGGIFPSERKFSVLNYFAHILQNRADITIVTNDDLAEQVKKNGGNPCVLPDRLPMTPEGLNKRLLEGSINIVFVCSYHSDEPYREVFEAAKLLPKDVIIYVTGNHKNRFEMDFLSENLRLTGFLPDEEYWSLLYSADIIIDLTTRDNCLVCGAYEAVALSKPMILSDTKVNRKYFTIGCVYTKPTVADIVSSIQTVLANLKRFQSEMKILQVNIEVEWEKRLNCCTNMINDRLNHK